MITVRIKGRGGSATPMSPVTAGSVGLPVRFEFSPEWEELVKTAVFRGSGEACDVALLTEDACAVPAEVLAESGGPLEIGVYGRTQDGTLVMPTVWTRIDRIWSGAELSESSPADPEPDWTAQVQAAAAQALQIAEGVAAAAARGDFNGQDGADGADGRDGQDGRDLVIQDVYATLAALREAFPTGNEYIYQVTGEDGELFVWSETAGDWVSIGSIQGPKGDKGDKGDTGATGAAGQNGTDGTTFTPSVSAEGVISWTNDGGKTNPTSVNIKGPKGNTGSTGAQGPAGADGADGADGKSAYASAQDGGYTGTEAAFNAALAAVDKMEVLVVDLGTVSSLPKTASVTGIETDMVCVKAELGTPGAQQSVWTVNTDTAGQVTVSGTISGSTTVKLYLMKSR